MSEVINILLVDDEPRNLDALEAILADPGYRLLRASDADSALRLLLENDVAAIVLDIKMPGVSGFELAALIKGTKKFRQIPIVFMTAYLLDDQDIITGYGTGAVDYLTKPVNPQILRLKVAVLADLFRKTRALAELNQHLEARVRERTAELAKSEAALREADQQKDSFLATLAHELRNPLAPLRTGLDILRANPEPMTTARTLAAMNRQLEHMVRLVDDLLDVSRISRGTLEMRKERVELSAVIAGAVETATPAFTKRNQSVAIDAEAGVKALVDPARVAQIIANLLHNASKHSPSGARVRVELRGEGDTACIRVLDEGAGIPSNQLARVFDMFTKIERSTESANDGLGIGLALSRQLAQLNGGTLTASSAGEGKGATFTLSLPVSAGGAEARASEPALSEVRIGGLSVVVIEDNEDSAETMATWLEDQGHDVRVASTGPDGLALVLDARPDVVLCDLGLPGMDGVAVCRHVISAMETPPVMVALTGRGMAADRKQTVDAGFKHHLVKPAEPQKLRQVLATIRSTHEQRRHA
jgi:signal transduction histidine kinase